MRLGVDAGRITCSARDWRRLPSLAIT